MKNILIYSHDTYGLGNIRRTIAIAEHVVSSFHDVNILIITGSPVIQSFRLSERIDYIKLPCFVRTDRNCYSSKFLLLNNDSVTALRANIIRSVFQDFEPDLILVDKNPCGIANELSELFSDLNSQFNRPKMVLLLRDILDESEATQHLWKSQRYDEFVCQEYDGVLVVGEKAIFDLGEMYRFSTKLKTMLHYCGYIKRSNSTVASIPKTVGKNKPCQRVLVMAGGGQDGYDLLRNYLIAQQYFCTESHESLLFCGPELSLVQQQEIVALGKQCANTRIEEFTNRLESHIARADLLICMGGYNTVCEAMSYKKQTIIVPRNYPVTEQTMRAKLFEELGLLKMIHPDHLTPELLASKLKELLDDDNESRCTPERLALDGLTNIQQYIGQVLSLHGDQNNGLTVHPVIENMTSPLLEATV